MCTKLHIIWILCTQFAISSGQNLNNMLICGHNLICRAHNIQIKHKFNIELCTQVAILCAIDPNKTLIFAHKMLNYAQKLLSLVQKIQNETVICVANSCAQNLNKTLILCIEIAILCASYPNKMTVCAQKILNCENKLLSRVHKI